MPVVADLSRTRSALWAVERNDGRGFVIWREHSQKATATSQPDDMLLLWTDDAKAERYIQEELRGTGRAYRIGKSRVIPFLRKMLTEARMRWVWLDRLPLSVAETESGVSGMADIRLLIAYLEGGGRVAGERRT